MSGTQRFFAGILGALMPICAILLSLDLVNLFGENSGLTKGNLIGIGIQFFIFMLVGGTVAYMHSDEIKAYKLFQIGMATPALLASFTTSNGLNSAISTPHIEGATLPVSSTNTSDSLDFSLISSAYAYDEKNNLDNVPTQQIAMDSVFQQVIQGISGSAYGVKNKPYNTKQKLKKTTKTNVIKDNPKPAPVAEPSSASVPVVNNELVPRAEESVDIISVPEDASSNFDMITSSGADDLAEQPSTLSVASDNNKQRKYESLLLKLQELENMQQQIKREMESLRLSN